MARLMRVSGLLILGLLLASCTRKMDTAESVQVDLSSFTKGGLSAQSTGAELEINFIAVNVSVDGVLKAQCKLDPEFSQFWTGGCLAHPSFPNNPEKGVEFPDVPVGNAFVQVLLVAEEASSTSGDDGGGGELFKYAEGGKALSSGKNDMTLTVKVAERTSEREGSVAGRYGTDFTGRLALQYKPENGGQTMTVFYLDMYAGWFNMYLLDGVPLQYAMVDETGKELGILFNGPVDMDAAQWSSGSSAVMTYEQPLTYFSDGDSDEPELQVLGFWDAAGNPSTTGSVCYDNTVAYSDHSYVDNAASVTLGFPTHFTVNAPGGTCGLSLPLVTATQMKISGDIILNAEGGDNPLFRGPFRLFLGADGEPNYAFSTASGDEVEVSWEYLPGVAGVSALKGVSVFYSNTYRGDLSREFEGAEGLNCYEFERPNGRFVNPDDGQFYFQRADFDNTSETVSFDAGMELANKGIVVVCPRRAAPGLALGRDQYYPSAVGAAVYPAPAVSLEITGANEIDFQYLNNDSCTGFEIHSKDINGNLGALPIQPGQHYTVSLSAATGTFYEDPFCTTSTVTLAMRYSGEKVFFRHTGSPPEAINPSVNTMPGETVTLTGDLWAGLSTTVASPAAFGFYIDTADEISNTEECFPVMVGHVDINGVPLNAGAATVALNSNEGYAIHAYWDDQCLSGPDNVADLSSGKSYAFFFVAPTTGGLEPTEYLSTTHVRDAGALTDANFPVQFIRPPDAEYMRVETTSYFGSNVCDTMYITTYIPNGVGGQSPKVYPGEELVYNLTASGPGLMTFYTNSGDCSGGTNAVTQITQSTGEYEVEVHFKVDLTGTYSLDVDEITSGGDFDFSTNVTVDP